MKVKDLIYGDVAPSVYGGITKKNAVYAIKGWHSMSPVFQTVIDELKPKLIIEVGTFLGMSAINMAYLARKHNPDVEIVCIDTFLGSQEMWVDDRILFKPLPFYNGRAGVYEQFLNNVVRKGLDDTITPFPIDSINGAMVLEYHKVKADLIYIDGAHDYDSCRADFIRYKDILRDEGVMLIDDAHHEPVFRAAVEIFGIDSIKRVDDKYVWRKPKEEDVEYDTEWVNVYIKDKEERKKQSNE